ncbi:type-1 angiotensin II receptor [Xenopus tropicalis]|uniref:Type-1 angiotensin II receptor n=1 Tax=Xenopus tropicalis TaxID=8364 RepID=A0A6I8SZ67_XENTR|nr:type-1 angiotensin II receptor [Xenopus tropicalis]
MDFEAMNVSIGYIRNTTSLTPFAKSPRNHCLSMPEDFEFLYVLVPIFYIIIFIVGILGNMIIVIGLTCLLQSKSIANIYIVNLAIADLSFVATLPLWAVSMAAKYQWTFGSFMCKFCATMSSVNMYSSIFLLTCLSIDRYFGIVHPMKSLNWRTQAKAKIATFIVWISACATSFPTMYFRQTYYSKKHQIITCAMKYPKHGVFWPNFVDLMKNIFGFVIPFIVQGVCYCLIYKNMLASRKNRVKKSRSDKVLKVVLAMVFAFLVCWLPFQIASFLKVLIRMHWIRDCKAAEIINAVMPVTVCIAFSNSCVNPILYFFASKRFRNQLAIALRKALSQSYSTTRTR